MDIFVATNNLTYSQLLANWLQLKEIDLLKGEQKTPEYEEINPNKTVPALTHGDTKVGFQMSEPQKCIWLVDLFDRPALIWKLV